MGELITIKDFLIVPVLLLMAWIISHHIAKKHINNEPYYKYFIWGLFAKIFAGLAFAVVYLFYYGGGDTTTYFLGTESIIKMAGKDFPTFVKLIFGNNTDEVYSMFDYNTKYPEYWSDVNSFAVCRFNVLFYLMGFGSFLGNTIVMNVVLYAGVWRFYKLLVQEFQAQEKPLAVVLLFIPSVLFWGSGILKDGWCLTASFFIFISSYNIFIPKKQLFKNVVYLIFWGYISLSIRPYAFYTTMASVLIWVGFHYLFIFKNKLIRTVVFPVIIFVLWLISTSVFTRVSVFAGSRYSSMEAMLETAWIIQDDLKKEYYGGNSFDIGTFEPTITGVLGKAPEAIMAGVFRPYLWEAKTIFMAISGVETLFLLCFFIYILIKNKVFEFFRKVFSHPFLISSFVFSITYSFFVGLTTANFGALVRYRMPVFVFFLLVLVVVNQPKVEQKKVG